MGDFRRPLPPAGYEPNAIGNNANGGQVYQINLPEIYRMDAPGETEAEPEYQQTFRQHIKFREQRVQRELEMSTEIFDYLNSIRTQPNSAEVDGLTDEVRVMAQQLDLRTRQAGQVLGTVVNDTRAEFTRIQGDMVEFHSWLDTVISHLAAVTVRVEVTEGVLGNEGSVARCFSETRVAIAHLDQQLKQCVDLQTHVAGERH